MELLIKIVHINYISTVTIIKATYFKIMIFSESSSIGAILFRFT